MTMQTRTIYRTATVGALLLAATSPLSLPTAADAATAEPPTRPAPIANAAVVKTAFFMIHLA